MLDRRRKKKGIEPYLLMPLFGKRATYDKKVLGYSPIGYWPMWEAAGGTAEDISGNGFDGAYTGVTLGQPGIGDGNTCPLFDGANDYNDIYSVGLSAAFDGGEGSVVIWIKVFNEAVWTDTNQRYPWRIEDVTEAGNNAIYPRATGAGQMWGHYAAGGVAEWIQPNISGADWIHITLTWSATADEFKLYYDAVQQGATSEGLGVWVGALSPNRTIIGAATTNPVLLWYGWLAHAAMFDYALGQAAITDIATR
jgi:hypothetical protein